MISRFKNKRSKRDRDTVFKVKYQEHGTTVTTTITLINKSIKCPLIPAIPYDQLRSIVINGFLPRAFTLIVRNTKITEFEFVAKDQQQRNVILKRFLQEFSTTSSWDSIMNASGEYRIEMQSNEHSQPQETVTMPTEEWNEIQQDLKVERRTRKSQTKKLENQLSELRLQNEDIAQIAKETTQELQEECDRLQLENTRLLKVIQDMKQKERVHSEDMLASQSSKCEIVTLSATQEHIRETNVRLTRHSGNSEDVNFKEWTQSNRHHQDLEVECDRLQRQKTILLKTLDENRIIQEQRVMELQEIEQAITNFALMIETEASVNAAQNQCERSAEQHTALLGAIEEQRKEMKVQNRSHVEDIGNSND